MNIKNECYSCGSYNTRQYDGELKCNSCDSNFVDKGDKNE